jgi:tetratricopeptide (TPR) repeat protein
MSIKLTSYTRSELRKLNGVLAPVIKQYGQPSSSIAALSGAIDALRRAAETNPKEWVYWYALGDCCQDAGEFRLALVACCRCVALRPKDPRSDYALGSAYYLLLRARHANDPEALAAWIGGSDDRFGTTGPEDCLAGLQEMGMSVEDAAEGAHTHFSRVLPRVDGRDAALVQQHLSSLRRAFPEMLES